MATVALVAWLVTAVGGFFLLGTWVARGGPRSGTSHFPPALIFGHFALAAIGLIIWIIYVISDTEALAWVAFVLLLPVAALGFVMLSRWLPVYRAERQTVAAAPAGAAGATRAGSAERAPEQHFPVPVVIAHGLLAVTTLILVLLTALGVGGS